MGDTWGGSWGSTWGSSWDTTAPPPTPPPAEGAVGGGGGGAALRRRRRKDTRSAVEQISSWWEEYEKIASRAAALKQERARAVAVQRVETVRGIVETIEGFPYPRDDVLDRLDRQFAALSKVKADREFAAKLRSIEEMAQRLLRAIEDDEDDVAVILAIA